MAATAFAVVPGVAASAAASPATLYVSPSGASTNGDTSCTDAAYSTIQSAVSAAPAGGTVIVCAGTYNESVTITEPLTLQGQRGAIVDATGQPFGYGVGIAADNVTVEGLTVENAEANQNTGAPGDGIVTAGVTAISPSVTEVAGNYAVIVHNITKNNDGSGIDLNSTTGSVVSADVSMHNGVGINLANDLNKPAAFNRVSDSIASQNPGGCGIVLADHTGAGVYGNVITGNTANNNGLGTPTASNASSGSGILIAGGAPVGGVYNNLVESNRASGNGHGGVNVHIHAAGAKWSGNRFIDNTIGTNNKRTDYADKQTTGIYIGSAAPLKITVSGNVVRHDKIGVFTAGHVSLSGKSNNFFQRVRKHFVHIKKYKG